MHPSTDGPGCGDDDPAIWAGQEALTPVIAVAPHCGHAVRDDVAAVLALDHDTRRREEDPYTEAFTTVTDTRLVVRRSRFEVDVNRPRDECVYLEPDDAWGLRVWAETPPPEVLQVSRDEHDAFYEVLDGVLRRAEAAFGAFVVLDLHSYNHRPDGPGSPPADPADNPDINVGTASMDRTRWGPLVDRFLADLRAAELPCGRLDVRENVRFGGAHLARWVHESFPDSGCALAIEVKKLYMDEHTGAVDTAMLDALVGGLRSTVPGLVAELRRR